MLLKYAAANSIGVPLNKKLGGGLSTEGTPRPSAVKLAARGVPFSRRKLVKPRQHPTKEKRTREAAASCRDSQSAYSFPTGTAPVGSFVVANASGTTRKRQRAATALPRSDEKALLLIPLEGCPSITACLLQWLPPLHSATSTQAPLPLYGFSITKPTKAWHREPFPAPAEIPALVIRFNFRSGGYRELPRGSLAVCPTARPA